jgi:phage baseplate assembly protein W
MAVKTINIRFPFAETFNGGVFESNTTTERAYRDDLISLLTTKRRQRVMRINLFSPIYDYLHEPFDDIAQQRLDRDIKAKVEEYMPQIEIKGIKYTPNYSENLLGLQVVFSVKELFDTTQSININFPIDNIS